MRHSEYDRTVSRPGAPLKTDCKSRRKMKCLISVGLVLPALAAVIGVVAWAVSADIVMGHARDNVANSNHRLQEESLEDPILQERSDNLYDGKLPVGGRVNQMQLLDNAHMESSSTAKSEVNSPSYIMVMSEPKSTTTAPTKPSTAPPAAVTDMNDFLSRIISASRESGNKIIVLPIPGSLTNEQKEDTNKLSTSKFFVEEDEDDETTTMEEEEIIPTSKTPEIVNKPLRSENGPKRSSDNYGDQGVRTYYPANNGGNFAPPPPQQQQNEQIQHQRVNPPKSYYNQHHMQQQHQPQHQPQPQPHFPSSRPQMHHSQPPPPPPQQYAPPPHLRPHHPPPNFEQNQGYVPKPAPQQSVSYFHQPEVPPPPPPPPAPVHKPNRDAPGYDSNRWGSVEDGGYGHEAPPKGITITFGSNQGGYGSDYHGHGHGHHVEPFSMIKSLFLPFLPKPKVNLNGRVVFGVVLEKGVGLGGNKGGGGQGAVSLGGYH